MFRAGDYVITSAPVEDDASSGDPVSSASAGSVDGTSVVAAVTAAAAAAATAASSSAASSTASAGKVMFTIEHILYKEQVKHLKSVGKWPFPDQLGGDEERHSDSDDGGSDGSGAGGVMPGQLPPSDSDSYDDDSDGS